jgi:arylsulfatase A-like enzyme
LRRTEVVEILDVAPTLLSLVDIPIPDSFRGRDLFDPDTPPREAAFIQHPLYSNDGASNRKLRRLQSVMGVPTREILVGEELLAIRTVDWKYLRHGDQEELYNLDEDPSETQNVVAMHTDIASDLRTKLDLWSAAHPQHHTSVEMINDELRATLEALGYLQ